MGMSGNALSFVLDLQRNGELSDSSGDSRMDKVLGEHAVELGNTIGVWPGVFFYTGHRRDLQSNAIATPATVVSPTTGTIVFGKELFWDYVKKFDHSEVFAYTILAHEYGHAHQYVGGFSQRGSLEFAQKNVKRIELHADFIAGYFLSGYLDRSGSTLDIELNEIFREWARIGDCNFNDSRHHGTPSERLQALTMGMRSRRSGRSFYQAAEEGTKYVLESFGEVGSIEC